MKKRIFKMLAVINRHVLPRTSKKDLTRLSKLDKLIVAYRYWVTTGSLD